MHRTQGDGFILDPVGGQAVFADEDPPTRDATQVRHQEMNALQEEICNVVIHAGLTLNADSETVQQMVQLRSAIGVLIANGVSAEALIRATNDGALQGNINALAGIVTALTSSNIGDSSGWAQANVTAALNVIKAWIESLYSIGTTPSTPLPIVVDGGSGWTDAGSTLKYKNFGSSDFSAMLWGTIKGAVTGAPSALIEVTLASLGGAFTGKTLSFFNGASHVFISSLNGFDAVKIYSPSASIGLRFERMTNYLGSLKFPVTSVEIPFSVVGHAQ